MCKNKPTNAYTRLNIIFLVVELKYTLLLKNLLILRKKLVFII